MRHKNLLSCTKSGYKKYKFLWRYCSSELSLAEKLIPSFLINNCIHKFWNKLFVKRIQYSNTTQKKEKTTSLKYLGKISLLSKKQLTKVLRKCCKDVKLNVVFKTSTRLRNVFIFIDQLPKYINSKVL